MPQILLDSICKTFKIHQRPPGFLGAIKGAFIREYKEVNALDGISFTIDEGELVGYIGPNGAGKSTTVKVMSGILVPDEGRCEIGGRIPWEMRKEHVSEIGVVFGQRSQLWWDVPVIDSFQLLRDIYNVNYRDYQRRLKELSDIIDIGGFINTPVRQLSLGQRMRCELVASLIHNPRILFLDEPTIGLDAVSKIGLREFLQDMNSRHHVTMILTTHDMDDIESLCSRVMVIGHGKILYDGGLDALKKKYSPQRRIRARLANDTKFTPIPGAENTEIRGRECILYYRPDIVDTHQMVASLASAYPISDLIVEDQNIDEMIAHMYKELML